MSALRYKLGKILTGLLDASLAYGIFPFARRFPVGLRFRHDLSRFLGGEPALIVDAGANIGQSALAFSRAWPRSKIISFEPVGETFRQLQENCRSNGNIRCINAALGNIDGRARIRLHENSELNSLVALATGAGEAGTTEDVEIRTLDRVAADQILERIDLLKIDTEGFELLVLDGAASLFEQSRIRAVYAECKFVRNNSSHVLFEEVDRYLTSRRFFFSGFYEMYRWGPERRFAGFANGLWLAKDSR